MFTFFSKISKACYQLTVPLFLVQGTKAIRKRLALNCLLKFNFCYPTKKKQEVQGLKAFAFPVVTVNDEHATSRFKRKLRGQI